MLETPKANRLHIAVFGRRNAGKSSVVNALTGQDAALVSEYAGTTTDPVYKAMELLPIGPVMIIDTAGLDDEGGIGELRVKKTYDVMEKTDLALLLFTPEMTEFSMELQWYEQLKAKNIPVVGIMNKIDTGCYDIAGIRQQIDIPFVEVSALEKNNMISLKQAIWENAPDDFENKTILGDIVGEKSVVVLVAPQDLQAPKGRLILPQVQVIRDILDNGGLAFTVKDSELSDILALLKTKPDLVVTDSQVFGKVNALLPVDVPLTSFSILMARYKGDLDMLVKGAEKIAELQPGDNVLIAEACTHHALRGDIGREKLPGWLNAAVGGELNFDIVAGNDFPEDLKKYSLIVHCGACMFNRKQMLSRIIKADGENIAITNYGMAIAQMKGILRRVTEVFYRENSDADQTV